MIPHLRSSFSVLSFFKFQSQGWEASRERPLLGAGSSPNRGGSWHVVGVRPGSGVARKTSDFRKGLDGIQDIQKISRGGPVRWLS